MHIYQCHDIALLGPKSGRVIYAKSQSDGENKKSEKGGGNYQRNKVDLIIGKNSSYETNVDYHIIYCC